MTYPPHPEHWITARDEITRAVTAVVRAGYGEALITWRDADDCSPGRHAHIDPVAGLRAARVLEQSARLATTEFIRRARAEGVTWQRIALVLGETGSDPAENAFRHAAATSRGEFSAFGFRCTGCDRHVMDHGPHVDPAEAERGHGEGCLVLAAAVAAYRADGEADR